MSSGSIQALTDNLLAATDSQGNVLDMSAVLEVVSTLERTHITAEDLKTTRLGKHVNMIRRKIVDEHKTLAKRLKKLVKQWQQLLQNRTPNGLSSSVPTPSSIPTAAIQPSSQPSPEQPVSHTHIPSPPKPIDTNSNIDNEVQSTPIATISPTVDANPPSTSSTSVPPVQPLRQNAATNFARNRIKMMQMLSSVKKPNAQFTQLQPTLQNEQQQPSQEVQPQEFTALPQPTAYTTQELELTHKTQPHKEKDDRFTAQGANFRSKNSITTAKWNADDNGHKIVSPLSSTVHVLPTLQAAPTKTQPEVSASSQTLHKDSTSLVPSKPHSVNSALVATTGKEMEPVAERSPSPACLLVSIPRNVIKLKLNRTKFGTHQTDDTNKFYSAARADGSIQEFLTQDQHTGLNFTVSIRTCLLQRVPSGPRPGSNVLKHTDSSSVSHCLKLDKSNTLMGSHSSRSLNTVKELENNLSHSDAKSRTNDFRIEQRQSSRSLMPAGAMQGVDGCVGEDGTWYAWSETIPGKKLSVTVLPYVYIDGFDNDVHDSDFDQ